MYFMPRLSFVCCDIGVLYNILMSYFNKKKNKRKFGSLRYLSDPLFTILTFNISYIVTSVHSFIKI